jgi:hypothetical protein
MLTGYPHSHRRHNITVFRPVVCSFRGNHCNTFVVVLGSVCGGMLVSGDCRRQVRVSIEDDPAA